MKNTKDSKLIRAVFISSMITMIASNLAIFAGSMVDGMIISRFLGSESMAAFQLSVPFSMSIVMIFQIFSIGVQNTCARYLGAGRAEDSISAYTTSILLLFGIGIFIGTAAIIFNQPLSLLLGATGEKAALAGGVRDYITGMSFGIPILCITPITIAVMFLDGRGEYVITAVVIQAVVDVIGDLLNMFVFKQGLMGMGIATSVCYYVSYLYLIYARKKYKPVIRISRSSFSLSSLKEVFRVGFPSAVDRAYKTVQMFTVNRELAAVAMSADLAAFGAINTLNYIYNPITMGIGTATLTISAVLYGERDEESIRSLMRTAVRITLIVESAVMIISLLLAPLLMHLFLSPSDSGNLNNAVRFLRIYVLYIPIYGINYIFQKYYNSIGNIKMNYILSAFDNLIYICILVLILGNFFGADGVFFSFLLAELLTAFSMIIVMTVKNRRIPCSVKDMLDLPEDIHIPEENKFSISAENRAGVICASEAVYWFCTNRGMNRRKALRFSVAIEEIGINMLRWGIKKNKSVSMDIRMVRLDETEENLSSTTEPKSMSHGVDTDTAGDWTLRIRDNAGIFDPTKWYEIHREDDPLHNFGLRAVLSGAKEIKYLNTMKINNLMISY